MGGGEGEGGLTKIFKNFVYQPILMKFGIRWFLGLLKPNLKSLSQNSEKGPLEGGLSEGGLTKIFKIFVYRPILMKFGIRWFFGLLKSNLKSFF